MPNRALIEEFERAQREHVLAVQALVPLLIRMALESIADVLPGSDEIEVHGEINEDWIPILRIQRVRDGDGAVLFDGATGHQDRAVEDMIDAVNIQYLDPLLDLTGDEFMGTKLINAELTAP